MRYGHLAQLVESLLDVQVVSGSIPLVSTRKEAPFVYRTKGASFQRNKSLRICEMLSERGTLLRNVKCTAARDVIYFTFKRYFTSRP